MSRDRSCFFGKQFSVHFHIFGGFSSAESILIHKNNIPVIYLELKRDFANFPSFPAFRIGSITHNRNSETPETFK